MKQYQKVMSVLLVFMCAITLSACIMIPLSKYYNISPDEVESVQFYDLRAQDVNHYHGFDLIYEPVYTVPEEKMAEFLTDFANLKFSDTLIITIAAVDPSFSYGDWVVRINYSNGQYSFYSSGGYGETYDAEGNVITSTHYSCDKEELEELIGKHYIIG